MTNWEKYYSKEYKEPEIYSDGTLIYDIASYVENKNNYDDGCIFECLFDSEITNNVDKWKIFFKKYLKWLNEEYDPNYENPNGNETFPVILHISEDKNGRIKCRKEQ